jgi:hypothetical protein
VASTSSLAAGKGCYALQIPRKFVRVPSVFAPVSFLSFFVAFFAMTVSPNK